MWYEMQSSLCCCGGFSFPSLIFLSLSCQIMCFLCFILGSEATSFFIEDSKVPRKKKEKEKKKKKEKTCPFCITFLVPKIHLSLFIIYLRR